MLCPDFPNHVHCCLMLFTVLAFYTMEYKWIRLLFCVCLLVQTCILFLITFFHQKCFGWKPFYEGISFPLGACVSWCRDVEFGKSLWKWPGQFAREVEVYCCFLGSLITFPPSGVFYGTILIKRKETRNVQPYFSHCFAFFPCVLRSASLSVHSFSVWIRDQMLSYLANPHPTHARLNTTLEKSSVTSLCEIVLLLTSEKNMEMPNYK